MATNADKAHAVFIEAIGRAPVTGDWVEITQERINAFAEVTEDHAKTS